MNEDAREGLAVMLALTAPIRLPGKTTTDLKRDVAALLQTGAAGSERSTILHGNRVELRLVERPLGRGETLLGFVHNADVPAALVLNLAKQWLHAKVRSGS